MTSLAARIGWSSALVLAAFVVLTTLALERAFTDSASAAMRERLTAQLFLVMAATEVDPAGQVQLPSTLGEPRLNLPDSGLYARIDRADGTPVWHSPSALGITLPTPVVSAAEREGFGRVALAGTDYFVVAMRIDWELGDGRLPLIYSVAEHSAPFELQMSGYRHDLWGWLGAMAMLLLLALAAALAWGLRPLRTVAGEVRAIESGAQQALHRVYPREIRRLTDNINTLLHHERAQQARYKNALADLAHSLKTPLAIVRGLDAGAHTAVLEEQVARMDAIVQHQLQRAATAGRGALGATIAVDPAAHRVLAALAKVYAEKGVVAQPSIDSAAGFRGEEGDLLELLGNLLDNAFKWCQQIVRITATVENGVLQISVEDDGPGIAAPQAKRVQVRGVRLDEATPGHGIGLAMVRDIVSAYEGQLEIGRSALGGAAVRVSLPQGR